MGALWGSNLAVGTTGNDEASLRIICEKNLYDTIVVNSLVDDENDQNKGKRKNTIQFIYFIFQYLLSINHLNYCCQLLSCLHCQTSINELMY